MGLDNPLHIAILLVIILLLFGAKRLPELGRSLGEGMRGFKDAVTGDSKAERTALKTAQAAQQEPVPSEPSAPAPPAAQGAAPAAEPQPSEPTRVPDAR